MLGAVTEAVAAADAAIKDYLGEVFFNLDGFYRTTPDTGITFAAFIRQRDNWFHSIPHSVCI
jgi:hypothetical protein